MSLTPKHLIALIASSPLAVAAVYGVMFMHILGFYAFRQAIVSVPRYDGSTEPPIDLNTLPWYEENQFYDILRRYAPEGRHFYVQSLVLLDLSFPFVCALAFAIPLSKLYNRRLALMPFIVYVPFDLLENMCLYHLFMHFPARRSFVVLLASRMTTIKWITVCMHLLLILSGVITRLVAWLTGEPLPATYASSNRAKIIGSDASAGESSDLDDDDENKDDMDDQQDADDADDSKKAESSESDKDGALKTEVDEAESSLAQLRQRLRPNASSATAE